MDELTTNVGVNDSKDPLDEISNLLLGEEPEKEDDEGAETANLESEESGEEEQTVTWASALGVDESNLALDENGDLVGVKVKVNGEESTVEMRDLIAGYQTNKYNTQNAQFLAAQRKEFEALRDRAADTYVEKLQVADRLVEVLRDSLTEGFQNIDWNRLRVENPGEYAALQEDFKNRAGQIDQIIAAVNQEKQGQFQQKDQEQFQNFQAYVQEQYQRVVAANPEWKDSGKMAQEMSEIGRNAHEIYGITPQEFSMLIDARHVNILRDAIKFRQGEKAVAQKVNQAPTFQKGGKSSKPMDKLTRLTLSAKKATGFKKRELETAAVAELLMSGSKR